MDQKQAPEFSVVVPVYNSQGTLEPLYQRLRDVFEALGRSFEFVAVNDASPDDSAKVLAGLAAENENIVFVDLLRNFGQQNAILAGLAQASGKYLITMDDDLQNPPEEIPKLIEALERDDLEVVYGMPEEKKHALHRNLGSRMIHWVIRRLFGKVGKGASSFRVMTRTIRDCILRYEASFTFIDGLIFQNTSYVGFVKVRHEPRKQGQSGYNLKRLALLAMDLFFSFSIAPLRFVFVSGLVLALGSGLFATYILLGKLFGHITFPGYASTMVYISLLFGATFMFLGLIGEYVGRIAQGVNRAPQFSIRKVSRKK